MLEIDKKDSLYLLKTVQTMLSGYVKLTGGDVNEINKYHRTFKKILGVMENKDKGYAYANEVIDRTIELFVVKELDRALIEYKFMVDNLRNEYNI